METVIIIVLLFMLLIAVIILLDVNFDRKEYKIRIQDSNELLYNLRKENSYLLTNNDNLKIRIDSQDRRFNKLKICSDFRDSKITELENKYQSAHDEIFERDEIIKSLNYQMNKYDKCNKQISEELIKKNNVIEDSYTRIKNMDQEKQCAINERNKANQEKQWATNQRNNAMHMANEMAKDLVYLNSQIELVELEINRKVKS